MAAPENVCIDFKLHKEVGQVAALCRGASKDNVKTRISLQSEAVFRPLNDISKSNKTPEIHILLQSPTKKNNNKIQLLTLQGFLVI
jgi:hypothetical protein